MMEADRNKLEKLQKIQIGSRVSIHEAFSKMDSENVRLLCIMDNDSYRGILSAGDIQRAIIANKNLETRCIEVIRTEGVRVANENDDFEAIKKLMLRFRTEFMPVINDTGELVDVHFWDDVFSSGKPQLSQIELPVVIMAGGKGTRLKPFSNILPKPLFPLGDKTIVETIMDKFHDVGCQKFFFSVNHKADFIRSYFDQLEGDPYDIQYFREDKPLGTAGSLHLVKKQIRETFFVSNCDILIDADYGEILDYHREQQNEISMVVSLKHIKIPYGTVETSEGGQVVNLVEKPELNYKINAGFYLLEPHLLNEIPEDTFYHITDLIEAVRNRGGKVGAFPISEKSWCDIGEWAEYSRTRGILGLS
ncbi:nucleotidyltransferase family protein [Akkermansiaceae bacterium]|nr:nucleotidyltransferase family protein [Akkermansiaceae bacterium]